MKHIFSPLIEITLYNLIYNSFKKDSKQFSCHRNLKSGIKSIIFYYMILLNRVQLSILWWMKNHSISLLIYFIYKPVSLNLYNIAFFKVKLFYQYLNFHLFYAYTSVSKHSRSYPWFYEFLLTKYRTRAYIQEQSRQSPNVYDVTPFPETNP